MLKVWLENPLLERKPQNSCWKWIEEKTVVYTVSSVWLDLASGEVKRRSILCIVRSIDDSVCWYQVVEGKQILVRHFKRPNKLFYRKLSIRPDKSLFGCLDKKYLIDELQLAIQWVLVRNSHRFLWFHPRLTFQMFAYSKCKIFMHCLSNHRGDQRCLPGMVFRRNDFLWILIDYITHTAEIFVMWIC